MSRSEILHWHRNTCHWTSLQLIFLSLSLSLLTCCVSFFFVFLECPSGYECHSGSCYKHFTTATTAAAAQTACEADTANLVSVGNACENSYIKGLFGWEHHLHSTVPTHCNLNEMCQRIAMCQRRAKKKLVFLSVKTVTRLDVFTAVCVSIATSSLWQWF